MRSGTGRCSRKLYEAIFKDLNAAQAVMATLIA